MKDLRIAVAISALAGVLVFAAAASVYPGGNHFDHHALGHDFWRNALCDVARAKAIDGSPNELGSLLAKIAMSTVALGIGLHLWALADDFSRGRRSLGIIVRALATVTVPSALAVVFLPTDRFSAVHGPVVVLAAVLGAGAATIAVGARILDGHLARASTLLGVLTLAISIAALVVYSSELVLGGPPRPAVPVLEHFAAIALIAWMVSGACALPQPEVLRSRGRA